MFFHTVTDQAQSPYILTERVLLLFLSSFCQSLDVTSPAALTRLDWKKQVELLSPWQFLTPIRLWTSSPHIPIHTPLRKPLSVVFSLHISSLSASYLIVRVCILTPKKKVGGGCHFSVADSGLTEEPWVLTAAASLRLSDKPCLRLLLQTNNGYLKLLYRSSKTAPMGAFMVFASYCLFD